MTSVNPTWSTSDTPYVSEVGLYDNDKNLMIISKVQSPEKTRGTTIQYKIRFLKYMPKENLKIPPKYWG